MKSQLIGKPPSESKIAMLKHEIVKVLRANPGAHNVEDISRSVIGNNIRDLVEFAKAIGRLEDEGKIIPATFGAKLFYKLASVAPLADKTTGYAPVGAGNQGAGQGQSAPSQNFRESGNEAELIRGWQLTAPLNEDANQQQLHNGTGAVPIKRIGPSISDFSILHRPHIVRKKEEVHVELCHECERMASGHCECGLPVCGNHSYPLDGNVRVCGVCHEAIKSDEASPEIFSNGRQV